MKNKYLDKIDGKTFDLKGRCWTIKVVDSLPSAYGLCLEYGQTIFINRDPASVTANDEATNLFLEHETDWDKFFKQIMRHEIVHALMFSCGLSDCSNKAEAWAVNEEIVDFIAQNGEELYATWEEVGALDNV